MHLSPVAFGLLALIGSSVRAAAPPSCTFKLSSNDYDLSALSSLRLVESVVQTPPTETIDRIRMVLCGGEEAGLGREEGVDDQDQVRSFSLPCQRATQTHPSNRSLSSARSTPTSACKSKTPSPTRRLPSGRCRSSRSWAIRSQGRTCHSRQSGRRTVSSHRARRRVVGRCLCSRAP